MVPVPYRTVQYRTVPDYLYLYTGNGTVPVRYRTFHLYMVPVPYRTVRYSTVRYGTVPDYLYLITGTCTVPVPFIFYSEIYSILYSSKALDSVLLDLFSSRSVAL